jgi:hypothetical protein
MSASATAPEARATGAEDWRAALVQAGLVVFASYHLALAAWMAVSPHSFFTALGAFGVRNDHYIRDTATFEAALGVGLLIALRRPAWRVPVLGVVALQFALHSLNHLVDIAAARPAWTGYFDFFSLAASSALLLWLLALARQSPPQGGSP